MTRLCAAVRGLLALARWCVARRRARSSWKGWADEDLGQELGAW